MRKYYLICRSRHRIASLEHIWNQGEYITSIDYYGYKINLYLVGKEYYEVFYNPSSNEIEKIYRAEKEDIGSFGAEKKKSRRNFQFSSV